MEICLRRFLVSAYVSRTEIKNRTLATPSVELLPDPCRDHCPDPDANWDCPVLNSMHVGPGEGTGALLPSSITPALPCCGCTWSSFTVAALLDSVLWTHHGLLIHSVVNGHLDCLQFEVMNTPAVNIQMLVFWWIYIHISVGHVLGSALLGHCLTESPVSSCRTHPSSHCSTVRPWFDISAFLILAMLVQNRSS